MVRYERTGAAALVTIDRPERRNAVDGPTAAALLEVGLGRALDLIVTGRVVGAAEAHAIGLVGEVVPRGGHVRRALALTEAIAAFPQDALLSDREAALAGLGLPLAEGLELEARLGRERLGAAPEGARRFAERE